jgi:hypothetical protein
LKIITYNEPNKYIEFYLKSNKNTKFKLELYDYLGVKKISFNKINLNESFITTLQSKSLLSFPGLYGFIEMLKKIIK